QESRNGKQGQESERACKVAEQRKQVGRENEDAGDCESAAADRNAAARLNLGSERRHIAVREDFASAWRKSLQHCELEEREQGGDSCRNSVVADRLRAKQYAHHQNID